ncbi:probable inactive histone-lysine N-methyltransferase SUVR2 isoform X2 [Primulina huaijiensis]|uniref:probable inactive histone-lysine N-methyltransferase SUVR2 isoform X2 n=1 Tax=Primulina huaijiensis TaxID=1492673 RepID=UPI003CC74252
MSKETKEKVANAFRAMKSIGISEDKVKPVLKSLLKLFDKNWTLIEEENYRALADAIFERDEVEAAECSRKILNSEAAEHPKKIVNGEKEDCLEEETQASEEPERPLKRLRHRNRDGQTSSSSTSNINVPKTPLVKPKEEPDELHKDHFPKANGSHGTVDPVDTCQSLGSNKQEQHTSAKSLTVNEKYDPCQLGDIGRIQQNTSLGTERRSPSHPMRLRDRGKGSVSLQSGGKIAVSGSSSDAGCLKDQINNCGIVLSSLPKQKSNANHALIKPKDEPIADDTPCPGFPVAKVHPDTLNEGGALSMNGTIADDHPEHSVSHTAQRIDAADGNVAANELRNNGALATIPDGLGAGCLGFSSVSRSVVQFDSGVPLPNTLPLPPTCTSMDDVTTLKKMASLDDCGSNRVSCTEEMNDLSLEVAHQPLVALNTVSSLEVLDIAKGLEKVLITTVNEVNDERPPSFFYIPQNAVFQNAYLNFSLARMGDNNCCGTCSGDCLLLSTPCACAHETGGEFAYNSDGLVKEDFLNECISMNRDPKKHCQFFCKECVLERSKSEDVIEPCKGHLVRKFIKECWWKCGCNILCGNRVVQRGISRKLQVFMISEVKGWGLRTLEDLPKGAFVCEYVGEVLTNAELFDRVSRSPEGEKHSYPVLLDADWGAEEVLKDEEALCLDATYYGNVARFINHRCYDSNMVEIPVEVETPDHHYYHLAFFTTRKVKAMEELTWDYGIDFDDHDHPIKAFHCQCGSKFCRNIKRSSRSRSSRR